MSFVTKTWKDRISEFPNRRTLTNTADSSTQLVTVSRTEGTISEEGDAFSASNMNDLETRIKNAFDTGVSTNYNVTIPTTGWSRNVNGSTIYFSKLITVNGITASSKPIIDVVLTTNFEFDMKALDSWNNIFLIETRDNEIYLYSYMKAPSVNFTIKIKEVE